MTGYVMHDRREWSIGTSYKNAPYHYSPERLQNFHHAFIGNSGSGKTFAIQRFISYYYELGVTSFVIDAQGDYNQRSFMDHGVPPDAINIIPFVFGDASTGINPLAIPASRSMADYLTAKLNAIEAIRLFGPKLGENQLGILHDMLDLTYTRAGVDSADPGTWNKAPGIEALYDVVKQACDELESGISTNTFSRIKKQRQLIDTERKKLKLEEDPGKIQALEQSIATTIETWAESLKQFAIEEVQRDDRTSAHRLSSLQGLLYVLKRMRESCLFNADTIRVKQNKINILTIKDVHPKAQPALIYMILDRTFQSAVRTCTKLNPTMPSIMLGFDEAKIFTHFARSTMSPINRIYTEGRKFGLGTFAGFQDPTHTTKDMRACIAAMFILQLARDKHKEVKSIWGIEDSLLAALKPKQDALVSLNSSKFCTVNLFK